MKFTPTKDFWSEELKSMYVAGMTYTVRPADDPAISSAHPDHVKARANRAKLAELVPQWLKNGQIITAGAVPGAANAAEAVQADVIGLGKVE